MGAGEIGRAEPFAEPAVNGREKVAGLLPALVPPKSSEARGGTQLPQLGVLFLRQRDGVLKACFGPILMFRAVQDPPFTLLSMQLCLEPSFIGTGGVFQTSGESVERLVGKTSFVVTQCKKTEK